MRHRRSTWHCLPMALALSSVCLSGSALATPKSPAWPEHLLEQLARIDAQSPGELGVYVKDLHSQRVVAYQAGEPWYLASTVKVPIAIAVLQAVMAGRITLDSPLTLAAEDYVDGAGSSNARPEGSKVAVRTLLEQMIIYSDNTASDRLIRLVGLDAVNQVARNLAGDQPFSAITTLAGVRRQIYSQWHPKAQQLKGQDFLQIRRASGSRKAAVARQLGLSEADLRPISLDQAYQAYYAVGANSAHLTALAEVLEGLVDGRALDATHTDYLLGLMRQVQTGNQRIKAGLPPATPYAQKTGTQRARACDAGLIEPPARQGQAPVLVVACVRGDLSMARSERSLRQVGEALTRSGLLDENSQ